MKAEATGPGRAPSADPVEEAGRIASAAASRGLSLKVAGGVGVALTCLSSKSPPLARTYADIDLAGTRKQSKEIVNLLTEHGYQPDTQFNVLHGSRRLFFWDPVNGRQVDVFLDVFEMCHRLDFSSRLTVSGPALPLADLLLWKLQVVETNEKDLNDILTILVDHPFTEDDGGINIRYLAELVSKDWGLWRTTTMVAERADHHARSMSELEQHRERIHNRVSAFLERVEREPKSRGWKLRARLGDRSRWYQLPEEAH